MKKTIAFVLICILLFSVLITPSFSAGFDARELEFLGQDHIYLGSEPTSTPPTPDGKIEKNEYSASVEYEPSNNDKGYITDATHYFSYDNECIYLAVSLNETNFKYGSNYFMFNLNFPVLGGFSDMFSRLRISLQLSDAQTASVSKIDYMDFSTGKPTTPDLSKDKMLAGYAASRVGDTTVYEVAVKFSALKEEIGMNITNMANFNSVNVTSAGEHWYYCELSDANIKAIESKYPAHGQPQDTWTMHILHFSDKKTEKPGFKTMDGARIKLDGAETYSMMFQLELDRTHLNSLNKKHGKGNFKFGMIIAPLDAVLAVDDFTAEALKTSEYSDTFKDYAVGDLESEVYARGVGTYIYSKHITGITDLTKEYAARAYFEINGERTYADTYTRRAVSGVAFSAIRDLSSAGRMTGYKNPITVNAIDMFSPYTSEQIAILYTLASGYSDHTLPKIPDALQQKAAGDLRVVSSNVYFHIFKSLKNEQAKTDWAKGLADMLKDADGDVLLLQEMSDGIISGKDFKWHTRLIPMLNEMGYTVVDCELDELFQASVNKGNPTDVNYTPILYKADKVKLIDSGHHFYESVATNPDSYLSSSKSYTWALFEDKVSSERFITFSTHLTYHANSATANNLRKQDASELVTEMNALEAKYPGIPVIVMGDLNCTATSEPYAILTAGKLCNAKEIAESTYNGNFGTSHGLGSAPGAGAAIDHALVSESGLKVTKYQSIITEKSIASSDHLPISIDISFK